MYIQLFVSGFFIFLSFFTKQDGGALGFLIASAILTYHAIAHKKYLQLGGFLGAFGVVAMGFVLPYLSHEIGYWFNLGQEPHYSRFSLSDIFDAVFGESQWIKFYVMAMVLLLMSTVKSVKAYWENQQLMTFTLLVLGILVEAAIVQVTSYTPPDNNIFYHSFAFAFLFSVINFKFSFDKVWGAILGVALVMLWWSGSYWKYIGRIVKRYLPQTEQVDEAGVVSKNTFMVKRDTSFLNVPESEWVMSDMKAFKGMFMPQSTVDGMNRIKSMPMFSNPEKPKVLNMTELTPLAYELGYDFEKGHPLWYHKNVAVFDREIALFCSNIENHKYDLVLFEVMPSLNNFNPDEVRASLQKHYRLVDDFLAPRRPTDATVEVYVRIIIILIDIYR